MHTAVAGSQTQAPSDTHSAHQTHLVGGLITDALGKIDSLLQLADDPVDVVNQVADHIDDINPETARVLIEILGKAEQRRN